MSIYSSKVYIWYSGIFKKSKKTKVSNFLPWVEYMQLQKVGNKIFCQKLLMLIIITKLISIIILEQIFSTKIFWKKIDWYSINNLHFLKYLWFLPGHNSSLFVGLMFWFCDRKKNQTKTKPNHFCTIQQKLKTIIF